MYTIKKYLIITTAALMLAACSNKEDEMADTNKRIPVPFSASVGVIETRAVDQEWSATDAIGIYMVAAEQPFKKENISEKAANIRYIVDANNANGFKADGTTIYYPMNDSAVDFYAYYPQGASAITEGTDAATSEADGNYLYAIDVATQTNQEALDFMYSDNVKNKKKTDKSAALTFKHQLCKVVFTVLPAEGVVEGDLTGLTVKVNDQNTTATFDLTAGALNIDAAPSADITLFKQSGASIYEAILLPNVATARTFEFNLNNNHDAPFTWDMAKALTGGSKYTYTVKLNRTGVEVTGTIEAWNPEEGGEVDAN